MMFAPILAMHIPDGLLNVPVSLVGWLLLAVLVAVALPQTRQQFGERQVPLMGVLAACVFAAQMINFPIPGGTSGHLMGGTLVAVLLGPWAAVLVMTSVIAVQGLLFQDGGLLVMGFNVINMGVISAFVGYATYRWLYRLLPKTPATQLAAVGAGAWLSVTLAAAAAALELAISGTSPLNVALPAMVGVHVLIGIGEALITVAALAFIRQTRPDLLGETAPVAAQGSSLVAVGLMIALVITLVSPLANPNPDGLERVAEDQGFSQLAQEAPYTVLPDYTVPFIQDEALTTIVAGVLGVLVVAGVSFGVSRLTGRKSTE
ncbi:MAG TPA: energy-coupling factor ABC transporter permease [Phototrophicaceae bacterium]|nr:energy-coupling factor ABC transporter permease [Phototrophicaceae bacterium]